MPDLQITFELPNPLPSSLPVLALRRGVLLPGGVLPLTVGRQRSLSALNASSNGLILVVAQREPVADPSPSDLLPVATLAKVLRRSDGPRKGVDQVLVQGLGRAQLTGFLGTHPHMTAAFQHRAEQWPESVEASAMASAITEKAQETAEILGFLAPVKRLLAAGVGAPLIIDAIAASLPESDDWKSEILLTSDPLVRARDVLERLSRAHEVLAAKKTIQQRVATDTQNHQREYLLRQQLKAIREELGETNDDETDQLRERLDETDLPEEIRETVDRELKRLERLNSASPERSVVVDWLQWIADMPWGTRSAVDVDLDALEEALDRTHFGLTDVKRQVVEHLAVSKLAGRGRADVLLLAGPPGVGKTSVAQAIADATGRKLVRVALGGVRDQAELRGHRRTYIGARPGRLIEGLRRAGTNDPVILLDEVDKLSRSAFGNPEAALLEILDPEQNHAFVDHYLEVPFDLSKALFIATANDRSAVSPPLLDRMETLTIAGYSADEKLVIAREHLLPKLAQNAGVPVDTVVIDDEAIAAAIAGWTREAGVRQLQRVLGRVFRAAAVQIAKGVLSEDGLHVTIDDLDTLLGKRKFIDEKHDATMSQPGIATGLAWTPVGGDVLYVEASTLPGSGGVLHLTGQLGDVMKESARAALTYVLANGERLGIPLDALTESDVHIHVPAGAIPKDGPSAGVTMFTALASLLSGRPVRGDVAMTGEATLRGRVLPVGGIKDKVLGAHRRGIRTVILPRRNARDLEDVAQSVRDDMSFVLVDEMNEALQAALQPPPAQAAVAA